MSGYAAGSHYQNGGGGSNQLCLHDEPQWGNVPDTGNDTSWPPSGWLYGIKYRNNEGSSTYDKPAPCAVCYVSQRTASLVIPARTSCPVDWTLEYTGYLMSEESLSLNETIRHCTDYICVDDAPEAAAAGSANPDQAFIFSVKVGCGSLPCSKYHDGWEVACIVCTK